MQGRMLKDLFASKVRLPGQIDFEAGVEAYKAGKLAVAAEHFAGTLRAEPEHVQAHNYAGGIDLRTGRYREALEHFERARMLDPQKAEYRFGEAMAHRELGAIEAARECCETALALDPELALAHDLLASLDVPFAFAPARLPGDRRRERPIDRARPAGNPRDRYRPRAQDHKAARSQHEHTCHHERRVLRRSRRASGVRRLADRSRLHRRDAPI